ncbi:hypothetical protein SDC9_110957 [bioreactor metagenome]|uniref:Uncharacterized protein n=1 Tax=bioreactor metagenome TaxID=1076179 RepID=A0A645BHN4_9ZZZZ
MGGKRLRHDRPNGIRVEQHRDHRIDGRNGVGCRVRDMEAATPEGIGPRGGAIPDPYLEASRVQALGHGTAHRPESQYGDLVDHAVHLLFVAPKVLVYSLSRNRCGPPGDADSAGAPPDARGSSDLG